MTFKELQKLIHYRQSKSNLDQTRFFDRLKDKPFWIWDVEQHKAQDIRTKGDCCFNHIIALPAKGGLERPLYDYQKIVLDALGNHKHVFIKKAIGLGISELMLRYMVWLCLRDNALAGSQMCIVTGPRIELAIALIDRIKRLFEPANIYFETKETVIELNGVRIEAFPSHHLDAMRGLPSVSFILLDESDFFPIGQQQDSRDVSERYIGKSDPYIVTVSTPNQPNGLFEQIERESEDRCLYKRLYLDYTYGLGKIYSQSEILKAQTSPSFSREYNLHYGGHVGNVFSESSIQAAIKKGEAQFDPRNVETAVNRFCRRVLAIDPGFGSSSCGFCIAQLVSVAESNPNAPPVHDSYSGNTIQILYAEEFVKPDFNAMIAVATNLMRQYFILQDPDSKVYVDGSAPAFIRALKIAIGENPNYEGTIARAKASGFRNISNWIGKVEPIVFGTAGAHKAMLNHAKILMDSQCIAIHPTQTKLITAFRTAYENDGSLDKDRTSHNDVFDAFRMCLKYFELDHYSGGSSIGNSTGKGGSNANEREVFQSI